MKRIPFLAIVLLACAFPAHAQDEMKKDAANKPADPEVKVVLDSWNEIGRKLIAMAEDFPEDSYAKKAKMWATSDAPPKSPRPVRSLNSQCLPRARGRSGTLRHAASAIQ